MGAHVLRDGILVQNLPGSLTIAFAFAWLLCRLHPCDVRFSSTRCLAPMRFCGRMCYSLYLVHTPVTILLAWNLLQLGCTSPGEVLAITVPVCVAASVLVAYLFYRLVERRCLNSGS